MTRINVGIQPSELTNRHLLAEHREIKRVPNVIKSGRYNLDGMPSKFCLGTGHVKFFYNKLEYLRHRYRSLHIECLQRKFNVQCYDEAWDNIPCELMGNYKPSRLDRSLLIVRLHSKLSETEFIELVVNSWLTEARKITGSLIKQILSYSDMYEHCDPDTLGDMETIFNIDVDLTNKVIHEIGDRLCNGLK